MLVCGDSRAWSSASLSSIKTQEIMWVEVVANRRERLRKRRAWKWKNRDPKEPLQPENRRGTDVVITNGIWFGVKKFVLCNLWRAEIDKRWANVRERNKGKESWGLKDRSSDHQELYKKRWKEQARAVARARPGSDAERPSCSHHQSPAHLQRWMGDTVGGAPGRPEMCAVSAHCLKVRRSHESS